MLFRTTEPNLCAVGNVEGSPIPPVLEVRRVKGGDRRSITTVDAPNPEGVGAVDGIGRWLDHCRPKDMAHPERCAEHFMGNWVNHSKIWLWATSTIHHFGVPAATIC